MTDKTPDISLEKTLEFLTRNAEARWGSDYVSEHGDLLEQAARHIVKIANCLPERETEPGFFQ